MAKQKTHIERWAFSESELKNPIGLTSHDELIADIGIEDYGIIVYRNGKVSDRFDDGTVGVTAEDMELAEEVEEFYHPETRETTYAWYDVKVDRNGNFIDFHGTKFRGERSPRPLFR